MAGDGGNGGNGGMWFPAQKAGCWNLIVRGAILLYIFVDCSRDMSNNDVMAKVRFLL